MEERDELDLCQNMYKLLSLIYDEVSKCRVIIPLVEGNDHPEAALLLLKTAMMDTLTKTLEAIREVDECWNELCTRFPDLSDWTDVTLNRIYKLNESVQSYLRFVITCYVKSPSVSCSEFASTVNDYQASIMGDRLTLAGVFWEWHMIK